MKQQTLVELNDTARRPGAQSLGHFADSSDFRRQKGSKDPWASVRRHDRSISMPVSSYPYRIAAMDQEAVMPIFAGRHL